VELWGSEQLAAHLLEARSQAAVVVERQVHVVDDENTTRCQGSDAAVEPRELATRCVREHDVEAAETRQQLAAVAEPKLDAIRPRRLARKRLDIGVDVDAHHLRVAPVSEAVEEPGKPNPRTRSELEDATPCGKGGGQDGEQRADAGLAGEGEAMGIGQRLGLADRVGDRVSSFDAQSAPPCARVCIARTPMRVPRPHA
jgi:hypothetical protein